MSNKPGTLFKEDQSHVRELDLDLLPKNIQSNPRVKHNGPGDIWLASEHSSAS